MKKIVVPRGEAKVGQLVTVPDLGIIGEVVELSKSVRNLITKIKVDTQDGVEIHEVEDLIVDAVYLVRKIRLSTAFQLLFVAIKGLFKKA